VDSAVFLSTFGLLALALAEAARMLLA